MAFPAPQEEKNRSRIAGFFSPVIIVVSAIALIVAVATGAFFYFSLGRAAGGAAPFGGKVVERSGERVAVAGVHLSGNFAANLLPEMVRSFQPYAEVNEFVATGTLEPPGMVPQPFKLKITRSRHSGVSRLEFSARNEKRFLTLEGDFSLSGGYCSLEMRGKLDHQEMKAFGLPLRQLFRGEMNFSGTLEATRESLRFKIDGMPDSGSRLEIGFLKFSDPGRLTLEFRREGQSKEEEWTLDMPSARAYFSFLVIEGVTFNGSGADGEVKFNANLAFAPPFVLNSRLPLTGKLASGSGKWSFAAEKNSPMVINDMSSMAQLEYCRIAGSGDRAGGDVSADLNGKSMSLRPDKNQTILWNGVDFQIGVKRKISFGGTGAESFAGENLEMKFRRFDLHTFGRRITWHGVAIRLEKPPDKDAIMRLSFAGEKIVSKTDREHIVGGPFSGVCGVMFSGGSVSLIEKLDSSFEYIDIRNDQLNLRGEKLFLTGDFSGVAGAKGQDNFRLNAKMDSFSVALPDFAARGKNAEWGLRATFPPGVDRPEAWTHSFTADNGTMLRGALDGKFTGGSFNCTVADSDLTILKYGIAFDKLSGSCRPRRHKNSFWQFSWRDVTGNAERYLDAWRGRLRLGGELQNDRGDIRLSGIALDLPFTPPAAPETVHGRFTIGDCSGATPLADSLQATLVSHGEKLTWKGSTRGKLPGDGGFFFSGALRFKNGLPELFTEFDMPFCPLSRELKPALLLPLPEQMLYHGKLGAAGSLLISQEKIDCKISYRLNGDAALDMFLLNGLSGEISPTEVTELQIGSIFPGTTPPGGIKCRIGRIDGKWRISDGELKIAGGTGKMTDELAFDGKKAFSLQLSGVEAGRLLPFGKGVPGKFDGSVTMRFSRDGLEVTDAVLSSAGATTLELGAWEKYRYVPEKCDPGLYDFAEAALRKFHADRVKIYLRRHDKTLVLRLVAEGSPRSELPFVYEKGSFRRRNGSEFGFSGEITISSDYHFPVAE